MKEGFAKVDGRMDRLDGRTDRLDGRMDRLEQTTLRIEQEHGERLSALFDGYRQNSERLERIEKKVDNLQVDVNGLTIKTAYHDNRIMELAGKMK
jgi:tetrahydromethanopterin S-methyltransferase subunit G